MKAAALYFVEKVLSAVGMGYLYPWTCLLDVVVEARLILVVKDPLAIGVEVEFVYDISEAAHLSK